MLCFSPKEPWVRIFLEREQPREIFETSEVRGRLKTENQEAQASFMVNSYEG